MLVAVTAQSRIAQCQRSLVRAVRKHLPKRETLTIGHQGGSFLGEVHYSDGLWFSTHPITDSPVPRHWNAFGLGKRERGAQIIVVEINPPIAGYTKQVSGLFARDDETGDYALLQRGRIGGGRKGIGKNAFADWSRVAWVKVSAPNGRVDEVILVARLNSPDIADQLLTFVGEVARFKEEITSGCLTRTPREPSRRKGFDPEFHGKKKGHRSGTLEYKSFHGLVVNKLEERVRIALGDTDANIFNTRAIDLAVEVGNELTQLYEVKSSADQQSIYTAIGQLMFHSVGEPKAAKTIVIPEGELDSHIGKTLSLLSVAILEYRIRAGNVQFST